MAKKHPNTENLIPNSKRSPNEVRENGRKGGIKSGETRRRKAAERKSLYERVEILRSLPLNNAPVDELGAEIDGIATAKGKNPDLESSILLVLAQKALGGDEKCIKMMLDIFKEADAKREQKEKEVQPETVTKNNAFFDALNGMADEVFIDGDE